jgi:superfamily II DNA or RNA helicase
MAEQQQQIDDLVALIDEYDMLVCRLCNSAVRPSDGIERHFRAHKVKGQVLADIKNYFASMELNDPLVAELPVDGSKPIDVLRVLHGYSCTQCRFLTTARDNIRRHQRTAEHGSDSQQWVEVQLQSWSWQQRRHMRYWIVSGGSAEGPAENQDRDSALDRVIADFEAELEAEDAARLQRGDVEEGIDRDSTWVKWTGWVRHFGSRDLLDIYTAAQWINSRDSVAQLARGEDEEAARERLLLVRLGKSFDREIERCCWRLDSVPNETLQWLASIVPTAPSGTPFGRKGKEASMSKYRSVGQRYLSFCVRAYRLGRDEALEQWAVSFTDEQWSMLGDVVHELEGEGISSSNDSGFVSGEDGREGELSGGDEEEEDWGEEEEGIADESEDTALGRAIFLFMVQSIKQQVGGKVYANPLLCFCAALGITKRPLGYTEPHLYTGMLAGVLWWARLLLLEAVFEGQTRDLDEVGIDKVLEFRDEHAKWMCVGTHSVISTVINWMAYGKGHRKRMGGQPSIRWEEGGQALFHSGERIAVEDFKRTFRDLADEAEGLLDQIMAGAWAAVGAKLDMGRIADSSVRLGAGQSFATDARNKWLEPGPAKVMRLAGSSLWDAARSRWKRGPARKRLRWLKLFREALMVLVHAWGGQPGRGPEVMTLRHCDSLQLTRNVYMLDGQVMLVTDRDKRKAIRGDGRKVARFLPDRIGRMVVAYIVWLLPFERMLCRKCGVPGPREDLLEFMWRDGQPRAWDTDRLSSVMGRVTQAGMGVRVGVARYRPIAIEMGRRIRGLAMQQLDAQMDDEDEDDDNVDVDPATGEPVDCGGSWNIIWDLQATHGTVIARQHYAVNIGYPGNLQPEMMASYREISRLWHQFLEHDAGRGGGAGAGGKKPDIYGRADIRFLSGPGGGPGKGGKKPDIYGRADIRFLTGPGAGTKRKAGECRAPPAKRQLAPPDVAPPDVDSAIASGLRKLFGPEAGWRSEKQAECMRTIMGLGDGQLAISVLPTGAGKSILFMLPAVMAGAGTSIVVVPYVALMDDLVARATAMGVDCIRFQTSLSAGRDGMARAARLVVVSADIVTCGEFSAYADGLLAAGLLQRIFVDECHTVIMDASYRARLGELRSLHRYGCGLVLLTATLPVVLEDWFRQEMLARSAVMVRDRTTKLNCRYRVEQVKPGKGAVERQTVETVRRLGSSMVGNHKGVVYCRSKARCETLAEEMGCDFHHSDMDEQRRREVRDGWAGGGGHRWIVATTGLGTGIDIEGIVAVVHMEQPFGLVDFVQQTGRGARRAGEVVESVVVHDGRAPRDDGHRSFVDNVNRSQIGLFVSTPGCRRAVIGAFMDGAAGETCGDLEGAEACDRCSAGRADEEGPGRSRAIWAAFGREEGARVRTLLRWLDEVADECAACHVRRHYNGLELAKVPENPRHDREGEWCGWAGDEGYAGVRRRITFGELSCCFRCRLPLDWCEATRDGGGCAYMDKVLPVVLLAARRDWAKEVAREQFGFDADDEEGFFEWLGMSRRFHGMGGTNALALWEAIVWLAYKGGSYWFR